MTWWEAVLYLWLVTAVLVAVYYTGRNMQRRDNASREEAIRAQAYKDGRKSIIDEQNERWSMMSPELYRAMYMGVWTAPEKHDTKER